MPPKKPAPRSADLFRSQLDNMISMDHALVKLARLIDWSRFDEAYGRLYHEKGRPGLSTRLMAGLHLRKHMESLSDEAICARLVENPHFQYFCGEQYFRHMLPLDRSSMTRWRGRIGADKLELLLAETLRIAMETRAMPPQACERVTVDTTVQTKAVAHPTDSHLLMRGIEWLNRLARRHGLKVRQSFLHVGRQARRDVSRRSTVVGTSRPCAGYANCAPGSVGSTATSAARSSAMKNSTPPFLSRVSGWQRS